MEWRRRFPWSRLEVMDFTGRSSSALIVLKQRPTASAGESGLGDKQKVDR